MPTPTLSEFVTRAMALADYRNLAVENPVPVLIPLLNGENMIVVVASLEPNNVTLPFNVSWIVADPASQDFKKVLRRTTLDPSARYRNTWSEVPNYESLLAEQQYWDLTSGFNLGEIDVPQLGAATPEVRGLFKLNRAYTPDASLPIVVGDNDLRMSNARTPLPHSHPKLPITVMRGASGLNAWLAKLNVSNSPQAGQILAITSRNPDGQWNAIWRWPQAADIAYSGPVYNKLTIKGPAGLTLDELRSFTFKADAEFVGGTKIVDVPATWAIIGNGQYATIGASTGIFQSIELSQNQTVRVEGRWTHPASGVQQVAYVDVVVKDVTVKLNLTRIEMRGMAEVEENSIATYSVIAYFDDGTSAGVTPNTFTSSNPGAGTFNSASGVLEVGELSTDQTTVIAATYTYNGITKSANLTVICHDLTVYPSSAAIIGPNTVDENTTVAYVLRVTNSNGTQVDVPATDWRSADLEAGSINATTGEFTGAANLFEDRATTITASYTLEGRTVSGTKQITVKDTTIYPRSAVILGSAQINENSSSTYQFRVTFSNDSVSVVTVNNWELSNLALGTINRNTGLLVAAEDVLADTQGKVSASYTAFGKTVSAEFNVTVKDITNYPVSARVVGNAQMNEATTQTVLFEVTYLDNSKVNETVTNWKSSNVNAATIGAVNGVVTAATNLQANGTTTLSASFTKHGRTVTGDLALTVRDVTVYPASAVINGPATINEGNTADYLLAVTFSDGSTANRTATAWTITGGAGATVNTSGRVTAPANVNANTAATLNASFTLDGRTVNAPAKAITIVDATVYPDSARIIGPNSVMENSNQTYQLEVTFTDATKQIIAATNWASSVTTTGTIAANTGVFSALEVTGNALTKITASYTANGRTAAAELNITVTDSTNYPVSAAIEGPANVNEGATAQYNLRVTFTDGSTAIVSALDWASATTSVGVINPSTGAFQAASNLSADGTTKISASYQSEGIRVSAERTVTVKDATVYPSSATISGNAVVDALATSQYELRVTFTDGSTVAVPAVWSSSNTATGGTINSAGLFTAKDNKTGANIATTLTGEYTLDGRKVTATKAIAVRDTTNYPASITITGANSVVSSTASGPGTTTYTAEVTYLDNTKKTVTTGTWSVEGATASDPVGTIAASGLFTANQKPGGASRNITVKYAYTEFGKTVNGTKSVALTVVPVPASMVINGAATVAAGATSAYTARVTMTDGTTKDVTAAFTTPAASSVATLTSGGSLSVNAALATETQVTLNAAYTANGLTVNATREVTALKAVAMTDITVTGPVSIVSAGNGSYVVKANFDDGTDATVTADTVFSSSVPAAGAFSTGTKGRFDAATVSADTNTVLTFSYTRSGVTKTKTINLKVTAATVTGDARARWGVAMFSDTDFTGGKTSTDPNYGKPYTRWTGIQDFADKVMTNRLATNNSNELFTMNVGEAQYGYFMALKSLGTATFTDQAINIDGGMGGITWRPEGETGDTFGGIEVTYDCHDGLGPRQWVIYRTDFDSLGSITFKVRYL